MDIGKFLIKNRNIKRNDIESYILTDYGTLRYEMVQLATFGRQLIGQLDKISGYKLSQVQISDPDVIAASGETTHHMLIATGHFDFVTIHPFIDGNGRTARLLMNLILMQYGYPPAIIRVKNRAEYILALETAQNENNLYNFYTVVAKAVMESIESSLLMLAIEVI